MLNDVREKSEDKTILKFKNGTKDEEIQLYGYPSSYEESVTSLFEQSYDDINSGTNPFVSEWTTKYGSSYPGTTIDYLKENLKNYLKKIQPDFSNSISSLLQEISISQQNFYQTVRKVTLVSQSVDGKLLSGNVPRVYNISGTSEVSASSEPGLYQDTIAELQGDFERFIDVLSPDIAKHKFNDFVIQPNSAVFLNNYNDKDYLITDSKLDNVSDKIFYIIMCRILNDDTKLNEFEEELNKGFAGSDQLIRRNNRLIEDIGDRYKKQIKVEEKYMKDVKKEPRYKELTEGLDKEMYVKGKLRKCTYDTTPNSNEQTNGQLIKDLYLTPFKFE